MLQLSPQHQIFLAVQPVDFRKGIDGLAQVCRSQLNKNPMKGGIFVFRNRNKTALKILVYDGQGFWLCLKRLSAGKLNWWPKSVQAAQVLQARELHILLWNGNPETAQLAGDWRALN